MQQHRRGLGPTLLAGGMAAAFVATAVSTHAPAAQLDQQTCTQLKADVALLEGMGVRDNMTKGAAWGKANLRGPDLEKIRKLIEMDEYIAFRCPRPKPVEPPAAAAAAVPKPKVKVPAKSVKAEAPTDPAAAAKPKPRPKPASTDGSTPAPAPQTAAAQPKPKPKPPAPKAQDAYTPPSKAPAPQ